MDDFLVRLIAQRMKQMDFEEYTMQQERVESATPFFGTVYVKQIAAQNEYWYLVSKTIPASTEIVSDTNILMATESASYGNYNFFGIQEFTGDIVILTNGTAIDMEFVRVIPQEKKDNATDPFILQQQELIAQAYKN